MLELFSPMSVIAPATTNGRALFVMVEYRNAIDSLCSWNVHEGPYTAEHSSADLYQGFIIVLHRLKTDPAGVTLC